MRGHLLICFFCTYGFVGEALKRIGERRATKPHLQRVLAVDRTKDRYTIAVYRYYLQLAATPYG